MADKYYKDLTDKETYEGNERFPVSDKNGKSWNMPAGIIKPANAMNADSLGGTPAGDYAKNRDLFLALRQLALNNIAILKVLAINPEMPTNLKRYVVWTPPVWRYYDTDMDTSFPIPVNSVVSLNGTCYRLTDNNTYSKADSLQETVQNGNVIEDGTPIVLTKTIDENNYAETTIQSGITEYKYYRKINDEYKVIWQLIADTNPPGVRCYQYGYDAQGNQTSQGRGSLSSSLISLAHKYGSNNSEYFEISVEEGLYFATDAVKAGLREMLGIDCFERVITFSLPSNTCRDYIKSPTQLTSADLRGVSKLEFSTDNIIFTEITLPTIHPLQGDVWWRITYEGASTDAVLTLKGNMI